MATLQVPLAKGRPMNINWQHIGALGLAALQNAPMLHLKPLILAARESVACGDVLLESTKAATWRPEAVERCNLHLLTVASQSCLQLSEYEARVAAAGLEKASKAVRQAAQDSRALDADIKAAHASAAKVC